MSFHFHKKERIFCIHFNEAYRVGSSYRSGRWPVTQRRARSGDVAVGPCSSTTSTPTGPFRAEELRRVHCHFAKEISIFSIINA
jgi:hypothetical protein